MPNIKSAKKELRKTVKRTARNLRLKSNLKTAIKKTRKEIEKGELKTEEALNPLRPPGYGPNEPFFRKSRVFNKL